MPTDSYLPVKKSMALVAAVLVFMATARLQSGIEKGRADLGPSSERIAGATAAYGLLGGARTVVAAYIWLKTDRISEEYYGALSKEAEVLPLYRVVTWLDPRFEDAYYIGSYMLFLVNRPKEGWDFALEGLKFNPESAKMELNVGQLALVKRHDYKSAIHHLERAQRLAGDHAAERYLALSNLRTAYVKANMPAEAQAVGKILSTFKENHSGASDSRPEVDPQVRP